MRLAGKDELHRTLGIVHHRSQLFDVGQNQVSPLVGGEAAGKSDGQRVRTEHAAQPLQHFGRLVAALRLLDHPVAHKIQQPRFQVEMGFPEFAVVHVLDAFPDCGIGAVLLPARSQMAVVKAEHLRRQPGRNVHAVGDVPDGNFVLGLAGIKAGPHVRATLRHASAETALARRESFRPSTVMQKSSLRIAGILASQLHQLLVGDAQRVAQRAQMLFHQFGVEAVVAGGHRSVRGENHFAGNPAARPDRSRCPRPACGLRIASRTANPLWPSFRCRTPGVMPMARRARKPPTPSSNSWRMRMRESPPYRREVSSRSSGWLPSMLESSRSRSQRPTFMRQTFARMDPPRVSTCTVTGSPFGPMAASMGSLIDIGLDVFFLLPAGAIEALAEISLAVKQSDADQRNTQVGSALDVIAGQHAEAAGVFRNRNVQAEFGGEVRHRPRPQNAGMPGSPGAVRVEILALAAIGIVDAAVQHQFTGAPFHHGQRNLRKQGDRIVIELPPAHRIEVAEQTAGVVVPTPPQVARQRPQPFLGGSDKAVERAGFADHRADLGRGLGQHADFILAEDPGRNGLDYQNSLQDAAIDQRNAQERLVMRLRRLR